VCFEDADGGAYYIGTSQYISTKDLD
jgi:hypothetical protein